MDPKKICVVSNTADLGVMVVRNLLIKLLREKYRAAGIVVMAEAEIIDKVRRFHQNHSWTDDCIAIESERVKTPLRKLALWKKLRAEKFDMIVLGPQCRIPPSVPYWCGIPVRAGLCNDEKQRAYLTHPVTLNLSGTEQYMYLHWTRVISAYARALHIDDFKDVSSHVPFIRVRGGEVFRPARGKKRIVVHVGGNPEWNRRWPLKNFSLLCRKLARRDDVALFLAGGRDESFENRTVLEAVKRENGTAEISDISDCTIEEMVRYIAAADLFIGNDSGPMNIAVAAGTPAIAIRGADSENFRPDIVDSKHAVVSNWLNCSRYRNGSNRCDQGCPVAYDRQKQDYPKCMEEISVDTVRNLVEAKLDMEVSRAK